MGPVATAGWRPGARLRLLASVALLWCALVAAAAATSEGPDDDSGPGAAAPKPTIPEQLPMLLASCLVAGLIASQAVYYDDDGDPTGLDQIPGGDRQAKLFGAWVGGGLFVLGLGGLWFQSLH